MQTVKNKTTDLFFEQIFDGQQFIHNVRVSLDDGVIKGVFPNQSSNGQTIHAGLLVPGFIDTQVNGGGGELFNHQPTLSTIKTMSQAHARFGTTAMMPTVITDDLSVMTAAADAMAQAVKENVLGILGIHFEGPHLSEIKRGIHPSRCLRELSQEEMALYQRNDIGQVMVTLAPERVAPEVIKQLVVAGVIVSLGHSNADAETVEKALVAGATGFTHLYNAMSPLQSRAPGMVGAALASDAYCGLIVDFHHASKIACKVAIKAKSREKIMLVTDSMSLVGTDKTTLEFCGEMIVRNGDKLAMPDGTLAGSQLDMATAVRNTHQQLGIPLSDTLAMASLSPAKFLGISQKMGCIKPGYLANFVLLDHQQQVQTTWINGQTIRHSV